MNQQIQLMDKEISVKGQNNNFEIAVKFLQVQEE